MYPLQCSLRVAVRLFLEAFQPMMLRPFQRLHGHNAHVLLGVDAPVIKRPGYDDLDATVVAFDAVNDLALLKVDGAEFVPLELGEAPDGTVGGVFGWEPGPELEVTPFRVDRPVTVRIEAVGSDERISRPAYLIAAEIESGDSGAALVDGEGLVVGVQDVSLWKVHT